ncbi:OmpA family protein [Actinomadura luteofluorescens]|uniref:OmpA family protein n=1 Tax=Actinomadura luteofluorescens TaxID=46163 RepID=UPI0034886EE3
MSDSTTAPQGRPPHRPAVSIPAALLALLLALLGVTAVACEEKPKCESVKTAPKGDERPFEILFDSTADATAGRFPPALRTMIRKAAAHPDVFSGAAVQGNAPSDFWRFEGYTAHPRSDDPERRGHLADLVTGCVVAQASAMAPRAPNTDLLIALQRVGDHIANRPQHATVAVVSNGLNNTPPLDLRELIAESRPAARVIEELGARDQLPALAGADVTFYGLGDTRPGVPALPKPYRDWLIGLWLGICKAAKAASCKSDSGVSGDRAPKNRPADAPFPQLTSGAVSGGPPVVGDTMFEPGSARLFPEADNVLRPVARQLRSGRSATVIGHTAHWGSTAYRRSLSGDRAYAVARRLLELGVDASRLKVVAKGSDDPLIRDIDPGTGRLIPDAAIRNRRVEIRLWDPR